MNLQQTKSSIGKKIKKVRKDNRLTQKQFAKKIKVHQSRVCHWERGENPSFKNLVKIQKVFGVNLIGV